MSDYIKRETLKTALKVVTSDYTCPIHIAAEIDQILDCEPADDVVEVRHGNWTNGDALCPICGVNKFNGLDADIWADWQPPYCPNCGAKMDKE